jgi:Universal stress protein family
VGDHAVASVSEEPSFDGSPTPRPPKWQDRRIIPGTGVPAQAIVDFSNEECADLIVMGTHGGTGLSHLLVGSTAEHVVKMARRSVLTVWCHGPTKC